MCATDKAVRGLLALALALTFLWTGAPTNAEAPAGVTGPLAWPPATRQARPWTRWWWLGSAVDKPNLTRLLTAYRQAGEGGVEITPIYGAYGYESRFLRFLSPPWINMLGFTTAEAKRLGLGVDMTTGTGWPNGGPNVTPEYASASLRLHTDDVPGGTVFEGSVVPPAATGRLAPEERLQCLMAVAGDGRRIDLTAQVHDGRLAWTAPPGAWRLYAVAARGPAQQVKRAAPGGAGNVLDPFSVSAMDHYLARFDQAFHGYHGVMPRSFFHDSYEYYGAEWTPDLFAQFQRRRGYDLRAHLPAFFGEGPADAVARVLGDYRETLSDLHLDYITRWTQWAHAHGSLTREQAHGSPTNLVDTYAAADIPETELNGFRVDEEDIPFNKMSSSAAHLSGRSLASSESFTWLTEHFQASLTTVKGAADFLFLSGVNHLFFHGTPYSPADAPWPGWQFYAAVNFGPEGGLWENLPAFNAYVTRCQSVLQSGRSANDVLLYNPVYDVWNAPGDRILANPMAPAFTQDAQRLWSRGYAFDNVTDRFLRRAQVVNGRIVLGGSPYRAVLVPPCRFLPPATLQALVGLARAGATILVQDSLPSDVPGLADLENRRARLQALRASIPLSGGSGFRRARVGQGGFLVGPDMEAMLRAAAVPREPCTDLGLRFVRRTHALGYHYFFVNRGANAVDGWVTLGRPARSAVLLDPREADRTGVAALRRSADGSTQVYLQLQPGESCVLRTFTTRPIRGPAWPYAETAGAPQPLSGTWAVTFLQGGPTRPAPFTTPALASWTTLGDTEARRFAGTARYTLTFPMPAGRADDWRLDLGRVADSARVRLNGHSVGVLWCAPFQQSVGRWLRPGPNILTVDVTNLAANRIADLDRRGVNWKYFYDANVASKRGGKLDAASWPLMDSGLLGPVQLVPKKRGLPAAATNHKKAAKPS